METEGSLGLAESYLEQHIIPEKFRDDARHIAISVSMKLMP